MKRRINEFESINWHLHDAHENVNVYSNINKVTQALKEKQKKVPHDVGELERYQLFGQMKSLQTQIDIIRRGSLITRSRLLILLMAGIMLIVNDMIDFIEG